MKKIDPNEEIYPIGVVSKLTGLPQRYLRVLEEWNVLKPRRSPKNRRLYSENDIQRLYRIYYLGVLRKVNISGIKVIYSILESLPQSEQEKILAMFDSDAASHAEKLESYPNVILESSMESEQVLVDEAEQTVPKLDKSDSPEPSPSV